MSTAEGPWTRPQLKRTSPNRGAGNYFRSAANGGNAPAGIPLASSEAAVVAAVRMAYRVAAAQIERSARLARRLREAGDQAVGPRSDRQALDATERLVFRAMMAVLGWVETAASDQRNPARRLATAQYRILGSLLGVIPSDEASKTPAGPASERASRHPGAPRPRSTEYRDAESSRFPVRVRHVGAARRAVRIRAWEYAGDMSAPMTIPVKFYNLARSSTEPLEGEIDVAGRRSVTLTLATSPSAPSGRWRAALCDDDGVQVGHIEIML